MNRKFQHSDRYDDDGDLAAAVDPVREELSAYLDDELDTAARAAVEQRLADDDQYRSRLNELEQAWDLLDLLPRHEHVDARFTQTTVAMATLDAHTELDRAQSRARRGYWLDAVSLALACLALAWTAYQVVHWRLDQPNRQFAHDLPVIERVDEYRHVDSVEFLRALRASGLFDDANDANDAATAEEAADAP